MSTEKTTTPKSSTATAPEPNKAAPAKGKGKGTAKGKAAPKQKAAPKPKPIRPPKPAPVPKAKAVNKNDAAEQVVASFSGTGADVTKEYRALTSEEQTIVDGLLAKNKLPISPMADMMPRHTESQLLGLSEDIKTQGQIQPCLLIKVKETGLILLNDGRNRLSACALVGVAPRFAVKEVEKAGSTQAQFRDLFSLNIIRRQASGSQLATVGADLFDLIGQKIQDDLVAKRKKQYEEAGEKFDAATIEKDQASYKDSVRDIIAAMLSGLKPQQMQAGAKPVVSGRYIDMARELKTGAPDLFDQVKSGDMILKKALAELKLRDNPGQQNDGNAPEGSSKGAGVEVKPEYLSAESVDAILEKSKTGKVVLDKAKLAGIMAQLKHYVGKYGYELPDGVAVGGPKAPDDKDSDGPEE